MCSFGGGFMEDHEFTPTVLHPLAIIEVPTHILGAYIVIYKTPLKMSSIKWSMVILHFWSAFLDVLISVISTPYIILPVPAGIFSGLLAYFDLNKPFRMYIYISSMTATVIAILGLFENRHNALNYENQKSRKLRILYLLLNYLLAFTFLIPCLLAVPEQSKAISEVRKLLPCLPPEVFDDPDFFVLTTDHRLLSYSTALISVVCTSQIFYFFFKILGLLFNKSIKSENTYRIQKKLYTSLSIQLSIPLTFFLIPITYIIFSFATGYFNQSLNNLVFVMIGLHGLISTWVMLSVHAPYRESVQKLICFWRKEEIHVDRTKRMSLVVSL